MRTLDEEKKLFKSISYIKDTITHTFYIKGFIENEPYVKVQKYNYSSHGDMPIFTEEPRFIPLYIFNAGLKLGEFKIHNREVKPL